MIRMNVRKSPANIAVLIIFLLFIAVRVFDLLAAAQIPYMQYRAVDEQYYHEWGLAISQGHFGKGTFFISPLLAYLLGLFYTVVGDSINEVLVLNATLGIASLYLLYLTSRRIAGQPAAFMTLTLAGFCVAPLYYEMFTEKTTLALFLTALSFYYLTLSFESERTHHWMLAGISVGLAALAHPLLLTLIPATWLSAILMKRHIWKKLLIFSATAFIAISPATIHNYIYGNDLVLICSGGGMNFYVGNHSGNITGKYTSPPFSRAAINLEERNFTQEAERRNGHTMLPSEVSSYWLKQGVTEAISEPALSIARLERRIRWTIGNEEITDTRNIDFFRDKLPVLKLPFLWGFGLVSFLGMAGALILIQAREKKAVFSIVFSGIFVLGISIFFVFGRLRLPLLVPFSILAGAGIVYAYEYLKRFNIRSLLLLLASLPIFFWLSFGKVSSNIADDHFTEIFRPSESRFAPYYDSSRSHFTEYYNMGNEYLYRRNYDAATPEFEKALWLHPTDFKGVEPVVLQLTDLYVSRGNLEAAQRLLQKAIAYYPDNASYPEKLASLLRNQ